MIDANSLMAQIEYILVKVNAVKLELQIESILDSTWLRQKVWISDMHMALHMPL